MDGEDFSGFTSETIRKLCGTTNFVTGHTYFRAGRVGSLKRDGSLATAVVQGANFRGHRVRIELAGGRPESMTCDCMRHTTWNEPCKHLAATLFAILEEVEVKEPTAKIQRVIANQLQQERRKDQDDAILRGFILNYFGERHLQAVVERFRGELDLRVTIQHESSHELVMMLVIPAKRVPAFLEAVRDRDNIFFKGGARKLRVADADAELEPDEEGTTILKISGASQKLTPDEAARARISRDWVFHRDQFYPVRRKPRLVKG